MTAQVKGYTCQIASVVLMHCIHRELLSAPPSQIGSCLLLPAADCGSQSPLTLRQITCHKQRFGALAFSSHVLLFPLRCPSLSCVFTDSFAPALTFMLQKWSLTDSLAFHHSGCQPVLLYLPLCGRQTRQKQAPCWDSQGQDDCSNLV